MLVGIVGKPNVGKSTFFKAATLADVEIANYPFATIKANTGMGYVRTNCADKFFDTQCNPRTGYCVKHNRFIAIQLVDVAGLVPGAHEGKGLGNAFLEDLRPADALIHVIDASGSTNDVGDVVDEGSYDPCNDVQFLEHELDHWYLAIIKRGWDKFARSMQQEKQNVAKVVAKQLSGLKVNEVHVKQSLRELDLWEKVPTEWNDDELFKLAQSLRKQTKPIIIAANKADKEISGKNIDKLKSNYPEHTIIPCSGDAELALREAAKKECIHYIPGDDSFSIVEGTLNTEQEKALSFIKTQVLDVYKSTGIQETINTAIFDILQYLTVYPGGMNNLKDKDGNTLPDCFLLPKHSTALDFAYKIHSDIGDNFIKAMDVKQKIPIGKEHQLKDGDVIEILTKK